MLANVSIISFDSFVWCKIGEQCIPENRYIGPTSALIGDIDPNNVTSQNAEYHFIPEPRFFEFVAVKAWPMLRDAKVGAINRNKAVVAFIKL
jgi:hypothetical protein